MLFLEKMNDFDDLTLAEEPTEEVKVEEVAEEAKAEDSDEEGEFVYDRALYDADALAELAEDDIDFDDWGEHQWDDFGTSTYSYL